MKNLIKSTVLAVAIVIGGSVMAQEKAMMKKDEMKKESMMKKDEMKKESMKNEDNMMKKEKMMKSEAKVIKLTQTPGKFNKKELKLKAGESYIFEVSNKGVDHPVGFVVAPKGKTEKANHITNAYVKEMVKEGKTQSTNEVVLEKGEYVFFCPMNPTPEYSIVVN